MQTLPIIIFVIVLIILIVLFFLGADPVKVGTAALVLIAVEMFMGVELIDLGIGLLSLMMLAVVLMLIFFTLSLILMICFKKGTATYDSLVPLKNSNAGWGLYDMDGEKFYCIYPIEFIITKYFYHEGDIHKVRFLRWKKRNMLFDHYSRIVLGIGLSSSAILSLLIGSVLFTLIGL